jgi:ABC-type transporter Mla MlaB component
LPNSKDEHENWSNGGSGANAAAPSLSASSGGVDLDVSWLAPADLGAVDVLARLHVTASKCGRRLSLHGADRTLVELLELVGLSDVLHLCRCCRPRADRS